MLSGPLFFEALTFDLGSLSLGRGLLSTFRLWLGLALGSHPECFEPGRVAIGDQGACWIRLEAPRGRQRRQRHRHAPQRGLGGCVTATDQPSRTERAKR